MTGFWLLMGHMIGDYIVQNDWMAKWKSGGPPWVPYESQIAREAEEIRRENTAFLACTVHCLLYTLAVWACSFWWMPWWGLLACFHVHWAIDRYRIAGRWMRNVSGQSAFASGVFAPWSIIVVDNVFHLLTLGVIAAIAGQ